MDILSLLSRHIIAPLVAFKDNEKHFSFLKQYKKTQYLSKNELEAFQQEKLNKLILHAVANVPFYKNRFSKAKINPFKHDVSEYFSDIPLLTKEDIQKNYLDLVALNFKKNELIPNKTGGSTGKPLKYFHNKNNIHSMKARELRHNQWANYNIGDKMAVLWGARRDFNIKSTFKEKLRTLLIDRSIILDTSSITEEKMFGFAQNVIQFKPKIILAYANSLYEFAKFVKQNNINGIMPYSIITSAEVLHDYERELIEEVFKCKIFNRYGCREVSVIASECIEHNGLHIAADGLKVEFINNDGTYVKPNEEGDIIITDFTNFGMPFIRYQIEDRGVPTDQICPCGIKLPIMKNVTGRTTDFLITPDGTKISGASITIYIIANTSGIKQAQFIQDKIDEITLNLIRSENFSEDTISFLNSKMPEFFGEKVQIKYQFVNEIPKTASGKYRFSICNIKQTMSNKE